mmetsp:Transcript_20085/g.46801  ORF Transcript_20085/g.46801 Transcript_20085/m.46801 type:complete len:345 (+) Transcript_20085:51-1085(+)
MAGQRRGQRQLRPRSLAALLISVLGVAFARQAFVGVGISQQTGRACTSSTTQQSDNDFQKVIMRSVATDVETEAAVAADSEEALMEGQRYIAMNRFKVRYGAEATFETRWATRKSSLLTLAGFRWFGLFRRVPAPGDAEIVPADPDEYNYVSFTIWENKKNFNSWRKGPAFKEAHGGGDIFAFVGMIINGFMTSKGPPKPAFWRSLSVDTATEAKDRLVSGPGGQPDADGSSMLDAEVAAMMLRFPVPRDQKAAFEKAWQDERAKAAGKLDSEPGFRFVQLLRRDQEPDDEVTYMAVSMWDDVEQLSKWRSTPSGESFVQAVGGIEPIPYFYEGTLVLESEAGA